MLFLILLLAGPAVIQAQDQHKERGQERGETVKVNVSGKVMSEPTFRSRELSTLRGRSPQPDEIILLPRLDYRGGKSNPPSEGKSTPPRMEFDGELGRWFGGEQSTQDLSQGFSASDSTSPSSASSGAAATHSSVGDC